MDNKNKKSRRQELTKAYLNLFKKCTKFVETGEKVSFVGKIIKSHQPKGKPYYLNTALVSNGEEEEFISFSTNDTGYKVGNIVSFENVILYGKITTKDGVEYENARIRITEDSKLIVQE